MEKTIEVMAKNGLYRGIPYYGENGKIYLITEYSNGSIEVHLIKPKMVKGVNYIMHVNNWYVMENDIAYSLLFMDKNVKPIIIGMIEEILAKKGK